MEIINAQSITFIFVAVCLALSIWHLIPNVGDQLHMRICDNCEQLLLGTEYSSLDATICDLCVIDKLNVYTQRHFIYYFPSQTMEMYADERIALSVWSKTECGTGRGAYLYDYESLRKEFDTLSDYEFLLMLERIKFIIMRRL